MRNRLVTTFAGLLLASAHAAQAQTPPTRPAPPAVPSIGLLDFGFRGGDVDGDEARFERYRDLRPGAATVFGMDKNTEKYRFGANAYNVGYRDQRYSADYISSKITLSAVYDSTPLNYFYDARCMAGHGNGGHARPGDAPGDSGPDHRTGDGTAVECPAHRVRADHLQRDDRGCSQGQSSILTSSCLAQHARSSQHRRREVRLHGDAGCSQSPSTSHDRTHRLDAVERVVRLQQREPLAAPSTAQ